MRHRTFRPARGMPSTFPLLGTVIAGVVFAVIVFGIAGGEALGCPNCKDAVNTTDPDGLNIARGYFYSILLMLAMPFTLAGSFGCYVWREMRRQQREQERVAGDTAGGGRAGDPVLPTRPAVEPHP